MNEHTLLTSFSEIDDSFQLEAAAMMQKPTAVKARLRFFVIAASLVLLVSMIPILYLIAGRFDPVIIPTTTQALTSSSHSTLLPPSTTAEIPTTTALPPITTTVVVQTSTPVVTTEAPSTTRPLKISLSTIPNAVFMSSELAAQFAETNPTASDDQSGQIKPPTELDKRIEWAERMKKNYISVIGTTSDSETVVIDDGELRYRITVLTLTVEKACYNASSIPSDDKIRVIYVGQYEKNAAGLYVIPKDCQFELFDNGYSYPYDVGTFATAGKYGLSFLEKIGDRSITIDGTAYPLSEYADYYMPLWMCKTDFFGPEEALILTSMQRQSTDMFKFRVYSKWFFEDYQYSKNT